MSDAKNEAVTALDGLVNPDNETETETPEEEVKETTSEETPETPAQEPEENEEEEDEKTETDWKAAARKWEKLAKNNKAAVDELDKTTRRLETIEKELATQKKATEQAQAALMRYKVAAKYAISEEQAELLLTGSDEETLEKQAAAISDRTVKTPRPDRAQGNRNGTGAMTNKQRFANTLSELGI
ncbi:hypothetical protein ACIQTN_01985 [Streptomyces werraensis]|uniref:hypothetical protein n=1 Tax=Streptomyces werraensis TaxID=68284 RepID=UPI00381E8960